MGILQAWLHMKATGFVLIRLFPDDRPKWSLAWVVVCVRYLNSCVLKSSVISQKH